MLSKAIYRRQTFEQNM